MKKEERNLFWKTSDTILEISTVLALTGILVLMTLQIIMRYFVGKPLQWTDEVSRMCMVWMTFLGSALAFRNQAHICVDLITNHLPPKASRLVLLITEILTFLFLGLLAYLGCKYAAMNMKTRSLETGISKGVMYSVIPISAVWMMLYLGRNILKRLKEK